MEQYLPGLSSKDLMILSQKMQLARIKPGQVLVKESMNPIGIFFVKRGHVLIKRRRGAHQVTVAKLGAGEYFGETAFLDSIAASATVVAEDEADVVVLRKDRLDPVFVEHPDFHGRFFKSLALLISRRLRQVTERATSSEDDFFRRWGELPNWEIV